MLVAWARGLAVGTQVSNSQEYKGHSGREKIRETERQRGNNSKSFFIPTGFIDSVQNK